LQPVLVSSVPTFLKVSAGGFHACGITSVGTLFCWGSDEYGQLGTPVINTWSTTPIRVDDGTTWRDASAGLAHTCAVRTDGVVFCWGRNNAGQVGGAITPAVPTPQQVNLPESATAVSASDSSTHSCALGTSGAVYCWGSNANGELGAGTSGGSTGTPQTVAGGRSFQQIATGNGFTCGLSNGAVFCWGRGDYRQLGSITATANQPVQVDDARTIDPASGAVTRMLPRVTYTSVTAGRRHACALGADGRAYCWGSDILGALGTQFQARAEPYPVQVSLPGPLRP
jgi:alpha-tubulin suppressor-like RCC1 family protein